MRDVRLVLAGKSITVTDDATRQRLQVVRYDDVSAITYSHGRDPMWSSSGGPTPIARYFRRLLAGRWAFPSRRHWISLMTRTDRRFVILRVTDSQVGDVLSALEERTGHTPQLLESRKGADEEPDPEQGARAGSALRTGTARLRVGSSPDRLALPVFNAKELLSMTRRLSHTVFGSAVAICIFSGAPSLVTWRPVTGAAAPGCRGSGAGRSGRRGGYRQLWDQRRLGRRCDRSTLDKFQGRCSRSAITRIRQERRRSSRTATTSWGRHKARTRPAPGNHDYLTANAKAYYDYFGESAGPDRRGYYSYNLGSWHIVSLNSFIAADRHSPQIEWLRQDLKDNRATCTLAYWHIPVFSSGPHGDDIRTSAHMLEAWKVLQEFGGDVVINGHDHDYERFAPQDPKGKADPQRGVREFVVGTGGGGIYQFRQIRPNSEVRASRSYGVLKLTLGATNYTWEFVPGAGEPFHDGGTSACVP